MTPELLAKLRDLCRDEAAADRLQQIFADEIQPLERELTEAQFYVNRQKALFDVITKLRSPLDLETIFQSTAIEVRQLLAADRVGMFRFYSDTHWNDGEFVSEDVDPDFDSAMAQKIHDDCFGDRLSKRESSGCGRYPCRRLERLPRQDPVPISSPRQLGRTPVAGR
jgi:hypothetical protein